MKYFLKKLVSGALLMLMMIGSVTFPTNAAARYVIYVDGYMLTASGKNIFNNREPRRQQIEHLKWNSFEDKNGNIKVIILDCGAYDNVFHTGTGGGYESHHLISSSFCRNNPNVISVEEAPAVLIPKEVHYKTGSHSKSLMSPQYLKAEQECFEKRGKLEDVFELGLNDLKRALSESGIDYGGLLNNNSLIVTKLRKYSKLPDLLRSGSYYEAMNLMNNIQTPISKTTLRRTELTSRSGIPTTPVKDYSGIESNFPPTPVVEYRPNRKRHFCWPEGYLQAEKLADQTNDSNVPGTPILEYIPSKKRRLAPPKDDSNAVQPSELNMKFLSALYEVDD
ncbi:MAG: hypothetical protein IJI84_02485 [Clostridia bacterium]|nr:hypothetical protein [Clostridia bacterium]